MARWINKGGAHHENRAVQGDYKGRYDDLPSRIYTIPMGAEFDDDRDMHSIFPGKFERVGESILVSPARHEATEKLIASGLFSESDRDFLERLPEDGFQRVQRSVQRQVSETNTRVSSPLGEDVTSHFQRAYDEGFLVFCNAAGKHQVTKKDSPGKALNKAALDKDHVDAFVEKFLKESDKK